jgi:hypothetical protein
MLTDKEGLWYRVLVAKYGEEGAVKRGGGGGIVCCGGGRWLVSMRVWVYEWGVV